MKISEDKHRRKGMEKTDTLHMDWKRIMDCSSAMIQSVDLQGNFLYYNEAMRKTLGYTDIEMKLQNIWTLLTPALSTPF